MNPRRLILLFGVFFLTGLAVSWRRTGSALGLLQFQNDESSYVDPQTGRPRPRQELTCELGEVLYSDEEFLHAVFHIPSRRWGGGDYEIDSLSSPKSCCIRLSEKSRTSTADPLEITVSCRTPVAGAIAWYGEVLPKSPDMPSFRLNAAAFAILAAEAAVVEESLPISLNPGETRQVRLRARVANQDARPSEAPEIQVDEFARWMKIVGEWTRRPAPAVGSTQQDYWEVPLAVMLPENVNHGQTCSLNGLVKWSASGRAARFSAPVTRSARLSAEPSSLVLHAGAPVTLRIGTLGDAKLEELKLAVPEGLGCKPNGGGPNHRIYNVSLSNLNAPWRVASLQFSVSGHTLEVPAIRGRNAAELEGRKP